MDCVYNITTDGKKNTIKVSLGEVYLCDVMNYTEAVPGNEFLVSTLK